MESVSAIFEFGGAYRIEKATLEYLDKAAKPDKPFFMSFNFAKVHPPNLPQPAFTHESVSKTKFADSVVENDTRIGRVVDKVRQLGLSKNTYIWGPKIKYGTRPLHTSS